MKQPYTPQLTPAEQERKARYEEWERIGNDWVHIKTGQIQMWHPMAIELGQHLFETAERLSGKRKISRRK